jgi:hypothetical protein
VSKSFRICHWSRKTRGSSPVQLWGRDSVPHFALLESEVGPKPDRI